MITNNDNVELKSASRHRCPMSGANVNQIYDPTQNVLRLVEEAVTRLDDLRQTDSNWLKQLQDAESRRLDEQMKLRSEFADKLSVAESKRIDAIRAVDVGAVTVASEKATQQALVLANQVTTSADALRALVATTATTMAAQSQVLTTQFTDRLGLLEKSQYENKGKSGMADPMIQELISQVKNLRDSRATTVGAVSGISSTWVAILGAATLISLIFGIYSSTKGSSPTYSSPPAIIQPSK